MIKDAIAKLADRTDLSEREAEEVLSEIMDGAATDAQIGGYLTPDQMTTRLEAVQVKNAK